MDMFDLTVGFNLRLLQKLFLRNIGFEIKKKWIFIKRKINVITHNDKFFIASEIATANKSSKPETLIVKDEKI